MDRRRHSTAVMVLDELFARERRLTWIDGGLPAGRPMIAAYWAMRTGDHRATAGD